MNARTSLVSGGVMAMLAVVFGAFAAHGLRLDEHDGRIWETAVRYQFYHALALLIFGYHEKFQPVVGWFLVLGTILFSGSLYAMVLFHERFWGMITPVGGVSLIVGWVFAIRFFYKNRT